MSKGYYIEKSKNSKDLVYLEYDMLDGYKVTPKVQKEGAVEVSKIVFVNPNLTEKLIKKKINKKIQELLNSINDDDGDNGMLERSLMDAERLRMQIIQKYVKYLGNTYQKLTLDKLQIIINELKFKLYSYRLYDDREVDYIENERKGKGR